VLEFGQALEADLRLDPTADVARDSDDDAGSAGQVDRLEDHLHGDRAAVPGQVVQHQGRRVDLAPAQGRDMAGEPLLVRSVEDLCDRLAEEVVAGDAQQVGRASIGLGDPEALRIEDEDRLDD
jgi:hypothetical protein